MYKDIRILKDGNDEKDTLVVNQKDIFRPENKDGRAYYEDSTTNLVRMYGVLAGCGVWLPDILGYTWEVVHDGQYPVLIAIKEEK